ncbi:unnamed protein product, partial [Closterium sp. NIES-54]
MGVLLREQRRLSRRLKTRSVAGAVRSWCLWNSLHGHEVAYAQDSRGGALAQGVTHCQQVGVTAHYH